MMITNNMSAPDKLSVEMIILSTCSVLLVAVAFQAIMPDIPEISSFREVGLKKSGDFYNVLIIYSISSTFHILLSVFFSLLLWNDLKSKSSLIGFRKKKLILIVSVILISSSILLSIASGADVAIYSHDRTMKLFEYLGYNFIFGRIPILNLTYISVYAIFLIICGVTFSVISCIWPANKALDISANQMKNETFDKEIIWSQLSAFGLIVSSVFFTSTVATISYVSLGVDLVENIGYGIFYRGTSNGMALLWSCCYSAIIIIIVLYPTIAMNKQAENQKKENRILGKDTDRFIYYYGVLSTGRFVKVLLFLFSPLYISILRIITT